MAFDESQSKLLWDHPSSLVYDKKLDTALRNTSVRLSKSALIDDRPSNWSFDNKLLFRGEKPYILSDYRTDNSCYAKILKEVLEDSSDGIVYGSTKGHKVPECYRLAKDNLLFQHNYSMQSNALPSGRRATTFLKEKLDRLEPSLEVMNLMYIAGEFKKIVDKVGYCRRKLPDDLSDDDKLAELAKGCRWVIRKPHIEIKWSQHQCFIKTPDGEDYWLPNSYILLIHNKLCDLISVLIMSQYQEGVCHAKGTCDIILALVTEMANLSERYGDRFANISGSIEGMVIGETLLESEGWDNSDLIDNIHDDLKRSMKYSYKTSKLRRILLTASIPLRNELGCLSKVMGHPFVDMEAGAKKLHKRTTCKKELTYESVAWVVNEAKRSFVKNYIARHGKWPLVEFNSHLPGEDALLKACLTNKDPDHPEIITKYGEVDIRDWGRIELQKIKDFSDLDNIIPYLKDKSISVLRNESVQQFLNFGDTRKAPWSDTRLLLYYLLNPLKRIDHQDFMKKFAEVDDLDELADYLIIRLVPKEKEHKIAFRGFGVKTYLDRLRTLTQEKNMAQFLSLYSDEQAMTMGELDISKRLYSFRTILKAYSGYRVLYVNFDSSGWNNCFRDETVKPCIRETVSKLLGSDVMHRIHEAYEKSLFIIPDGDVTYSWDGQQGGIDGLNQYAWVWVYINQIKYAMKGLNAKYHMFCKGDDMRLAILIHPEMLLHHDMKYWHGHIVNRVEKVATEFGHEIKIQESYGSERYFTFSKSASLGRVELPQGFRKIQKTYGANNALMATLDEYIASTFSNAHSACKCMTNTYSAYFTALVWSYWYLKCSPYYNSLSDHELVALMLIPNMMGGFPMIYLHNMRVRAESDLLSPFLAMIKFADANNRQLSVAMKRFLRHEVIKKKDFTKLYRDPYGLCIRLPSLPSSVLRSMILPILKRKVRNEDIRDLIKASESKQSREIIKCMASADPQDAKILATIYSATPEGVLGELLRKFETGRSILSLLLLRTSINQVNFKLRKIIIAENRLQIWRSKKLSGELLDNSRRLINMTDYDCPTQAAQYLRDSTWGKKICGVSMPPLSHQVKVIRPVDCLNDKHAKSNHFEYSYDPPNELIQEGVSPHWGVGKQDPFLGYTTRTGNIAPTVSFVEKDPLILKVRNCLDLYSWILKDKLNEQGLLVRSNINKLLDHILEMYTHITPEELAPFSAKRRSGTVQHHARAPRFREAIIPNILSNMYQNVSGSSDSHITLRRSDMHYTVNFLHIMCECIHQIHMELETTDSLTPSQRIWGVTSDCAYCNTPIEEEPMVVDLSYLTTRENSLMKSCRLEHISKKIILDSFNDFSETLFKVADDDSSPSIELAQIGVCQEFICHYMKTHVTLQARFTQHHLNRGAHNTLVNLTHATTSRIIGYTELKKIPLRILAEALSTYICEYIDRKFTSYDQEGILLELQKVHSAELPWQGILEIILKVGKLGQFINYLAHMSGTSVVACYENAVSSAPFVGYCIYKMVIQGTTIPRLCIRTYMDRDQSVIDLEKIFTPTKWKLLHTGFGELTKQWRPGLEDETLKTNITRRGLYICSLAIDADAVLDKISNVDSSNVLIDISVKDYVTLEENDCYMTLEDATCQSYAMYSRVKMTYPSWNWSEVEAELLQNGMNYEVVNIVLRCVESTSIQVGYSDIAACIGVVRGSTNEADDLEAIRYNSSDTENGRGERVHFVNEIMRSNFQRIKPSPTVFSPKGKTSDPKEEYEHLIIERDFTSNKILLDNAHSLRLFGGGTTSQSKLDHVLTTCQIDRLFPDSICILCAGDGHGGFVEYLSTRTSHSLFVYNTLPDRSGANSFPYAAYRTLRENNNKVDTEDIDEGIYDLAREETVTALSSKPFLYSVITCDAEVKWDDYVIARNVLFNMCKIYLSSGSLDCVFVCKSNLGLAQEVINAVSTLRRYARNVVVVRCPQSNLGGEIYIVAQGITSRPPDVHGLTFSSSLPEQIDFQVYVDRIYNWFKDAERTQPAIDLYIPVTRSCIYVFNSLSCAANAKLRVRIGLDLDLKGEVRRSKDYDSLREFLIKKITVVLDKAYDMMWYPKKHRIKGAAYHQDTTAHLINTSMKYLSIAGCYVTIMESCRADSMTKRRLRELYADSLDKIPDRVGYNTASVDHYSTGFMINDHKFNAPYMRFMDGVRTAQMILGYMRHSRLPRRNDENDLTHIRVLYTDP